MDSWGSLRRGRGSRKWGIAWPRRKNSDGKIRFDLLTKFLNSPLLMKRAVRLIIAFLWGKTWKKDHGASGGPSSAQLPRGGWVATGHFLPPWHTVQKRSPTCSIFVRCAAGDSPFGRERDMLRRALISPPLSKASPASHSE